jgi:hypothetical protein
MSNNIGYESDNGSKKEERGQEDSEERELQGADIEVRGALKRQASILERNVIGPKGLGVHDPKASES